MAGTAAEKWLTGRHSHVGARDDYSKAADLAMYAAGSNDEVEALLRWLQLRAANAVCSRWCFIEAVAKELLERETLTGRQIREVIEAEFTRQIPQRKLA